MSNPLSTWLRLATPKERSILARDAETSVNYLYQLCGTAKHRPRPGAKLASDIEAGTILARAINPSLPVVTMQDVAGLSNG